MGRATAEGIAETGLSLDDQIHWHLRGNFYPPIPASMVKPCVEAIEACNEDSPNKQIEMPEGVYYKGNKTAPAWAIVDQHRLETWLDGVDYE